MIEFNPNARAQNLTKLEWMAGMVAGGFVENKDRPGYFHPDEDAQWIVRLAKLILMEVAKHEKANT